MNQEFHDHLDVCVQCRTHPMSLCANGVRLLYNQAMAPAAALVERATPEQEERERDTLETWRIAALSKDRTRRAIRERVKAGENQMDVADDYGVPLAFVSHLAQWQLFGDEPPAVAVRAAQAHEPLKDLIATWREEAQRYRDHAIQSAANSQTAPPFERGVALGRGLCAKDLEAALRSLRSDREREAEQP